MAPNLVEVDNLTLEFGVPGGTRARVLDGVSFSIKPGERYALVGESGSGKTVCALSILRLNDETQAHYPSGSIRFAGRYSARTPLPSSRLPTSPIVFTCACACSR